MLEIPAFFTFAVFALTTIFVMWRPFGMNEAIPAMIGAILLIAAKIVSFHDMFDIFQIVSGPSTTIIATIMMCMILEKIGVFRWAALNIVNKANGSGVRLFFYTLFLCFLMTVFFNNDGSILITTPIILHMIAMLKLKMKHKLPYLFGGVFIATASSLPIGVSNIANLIGLKMVGLNLISYTNMVLVPSLIGILTLACLLYVYFRKDIPKQVPTLAYDHTQKWLEPRGTSLDWTLFRLCIAIVIIVRGSYFLLSPMGVHIEWIAIAGVIVLLFVYWWKTKEVVSDIFKYAPWHIIFFAFGMYVTVYALNNSGLTSFLIPFLQENITNDDSSAIFTFGILTTMLSNVMNNLPSVMLGTIMLTSVGLETFALQVSYLAIIIASDIGALLTPMGTLATLLWMFVLRKEKVHITWRSYIKVALTVVPVTLLVTLIVFNLWIKITML